MRAPRDLMGKMLQPADTIRMNWTVPNLGEIVTKEGPVYYDIEEDQFYFDGIPLEIYDEFTIIK